MIRLRPTPDSTRELEQLFQRIERALDPPDADLEPTRNAVRDGFALNFADEASGWGPWEALAPRTVIERRRLGFGPEHPILIRTGDYWESWIDPENPDHISETRRGGGLTTMEEGSDDYRVDWHEMGTVIMPARPVGILQAPAEYRIGETITAMLDRLLPRD